MSSSPQLEGLDGLDALERHHLEARIQALEEAVLALEEEKQDLELLLETTTLHSDHVEADLYELTQQLQEQIVERERTAVALKRSGQELQSLLSIVRRDNEDLEMVLHTTVSHGDTIESLLFDAEEKYRSIFRHAVEGIAQIDLDGIYISVNHALAQIYGHDCPEDFLQDVIGVHHQPSVGTHSRVHFLELLQQEGIVVNYESLVYRRDGSIIWICENACAVCNRAGDPLYYVCTVEDITQRKQAQEALRRSQQQLQKQNAELQLINQRLQTEIAKRQQIEEALQYANQELLRLASLDSLTQISNRRAIEIEGSQIWAQAIEDGSSLAVVMVDVDCFKAYNDHYGHQAGDSSLYQVAQAIVRALPHEEDRVVRYGGEEFLVLMPKTELEGALQAAKAIQQEVAQLSLPHERSLVSTNITVSLGVAATYPHPSHGLSALIGKADEALYKSKQEGRNRITFV